MDNISSPTIIYPTLKLNCGNSEECHKLPPTLKYCLHSARTVVAPGLPLNFFGQQKHNSESKTCPVCRSPANYTSVLKGLNDKVGLLFTFVLLAYLRSIFSLSLFFISVT